MGFIKRTVFAILGAGFLLCACNAQEKTPAEVLTEQNVRVLRFQVSATLGQDILAQADAFSDYVDKVSAGNMRVEVTIGMPDHHSVAQGDTDFTILTSAQMVQANEVFSMFSMPFLYSNYNHMGMALNSKRIMDELSKRLEESKIVPLAALPESSSALISDIRPIRLPEDFEELSVAMRADNANKLSAFEALGARVLPYTQPSVYEMLGQDVEVLPEDLQQPSVMVRVNATEIELDRVKELGEYDGVYLMNTYHNISPLWFVSNREMMLGLSTKEKAILQEGCAVLMASVDLKLQKEEEALLNEIRKSGVKLIDPERPDIALFLYGARGDGNGTYLLPDSFDPALYLLIQEYDA